MQKQQICLRLVLTLLGIASLTVEMAHADATGDRRRAQLASVRRILVIPPFFGTDTIAKADAEAAAKTR